MAKMKIAVTGGSGKAGRWIVSELLNHGYDVLNLDSKLPDQPLCPTNVVDLNDLGQVHSVLGGGSSRDRKACDAVIHFAAIPQAFTHASDITFRNNVMSTYNVLEACANLGIGKAVVASSESTYGYVFADRFFEPKYLPVDENHPVFPEDSYGLSKVVGEQTAEMFHRRTGMQVVSFRLGNILDPSDYSAVIDSFSDPEARLRNLWSYIDVRDVASACRLAIEKSGLGAQTLIISADDTSSNRPTEELVAQYLPGVKEINMRLDGRSALLSNERAKVVLGWRQQFFLQEDAEF
jgi:nucleoside-diphosphate-sugar epimerase